MALVDNILTAAGFVVNETYRETRFLTPPGETYAVFNDSILRRGADKVNLLTEHDVTIELYQYAPDPDSEKRIEAQLNLIGQVYTKQERYWIEEEQIYQIIYSFSYISKEV